jgi:hypothetical protein
MVVISDYHPYTMGEMVVISDYHPYTMGEMVDISDYHPIFLRGVDRLIWMFSYRYFFYS